MSFFFNQKKKIASLLQGFVDIHCHVLPGLDDGSKNMADTRAMLLEYEKMGIKKIIATPHILKGSYPNTKDSISGAYEKTKIELKKADCANLIESFAAEHMLDEDFEGLLKDRALLPLKSNYVLIEMSYFQKPINLPELIFNIGHQGYRPVLAHPERYNFIKSQNGYLRLKKMGCYFQLNLLSLDRHYGPQVQKKARALLKNGSYDFAGTDAHHKMHLAKIAEIVLSKKNCSALEKVIDKTVDVFE